MANLPAFLRAKAAAGPEPARPQLDLNGDVLAAALREMAEGAEQHGGVERYVEAVKLKGLLFREVLADGPAGLAPEGFQEICTFMPTVRRRVAPYLDEAGFARMRAALTGLLGGAEDVTTCDARLAALCACFPADREHRFVRDLGAEILHHFDAARYPLMTRWVWDARANTGVLREIWFAEDLDHFTIPVPDEFATFLMLREELAQYLTQNGVYRDVLEYVDLLCAQIYAQYICAQGGTYLRTDFSAPEDPMLHARRMLGLDGVRPGSNRTRLKAIDGTAYRIDDARRVG